MKFASRTRRPMFETLESRVQPGSMLTSGLGQLGGLLDLENLMNNSTSRAQELAVKVIQQGETSGSAKSDQLVIDHQAPSNDLGLNNGQIGITSNDGSDAKSYDGGNLSFIDLGTHVLGGSLWYSGDFNGVNGLANESSTYVSQASVYDNFQVDSGEFWFVGGVWSSNLMSARTFTADWSVRTGVSEGSGGTVVAGGASAAGCTSQYFTDNEGFGFIEFSVAVDLACNGAALTLTAGTYWLNVTPRGNGAGRSFQSTTSGANSVGTQLPGGSFFDSSYFGYTFTNVENLLGTGPWDFSGGLFGGCVGC